MLRSGRRPPLAAARAANARGCRCRPCRGEAPNVTRELLRRGYTEAQIGKIWGGNFLRVFSEVEAVSRKLKK